MKEGSGRRNVVALIVLALARGAGVGAYMLLYSIYLSKLGYSIHGIGLTITIASIIAAATGPGFGTLLDTVGSRIAVAVTGSLPAVALLLLNTKLYPLLVLSYIVSMMGFMYGQPARMTLLYRSIGVEALGWNVSLMSIGFGVSRAIGSYVGGLLADIAGFHTTFTILGLVVVAGVVAFMAISVEETGRRGRCSLSKAVLEAYRRAIRPDRRMAVLYSIVAVDRIAWTLWFPMISAILYKMGLSVSQVAVIYTVQSMVQTLSVPLFGYLSDRIDPRKILAFSEAAGLAGAALLATHHPLPAFISIGFSIAAWIPGYNKTVGLLARGRPGEAYATTNTVRIVAGSLTPYIGGYIHDVYGLTTLLSLSATLMFTAALIALALLPKPGGAE